MQPHVKSFVVFLAGWTAVAFVLLLLLSDFFSAWDGRVVSVRSGDPERATAQVLVVEDAGDRFETTWSRDALDGIEVAIDRFALPPIPLPPGLTRTTKERFTLSYTLQPEGAGVRTVATTGQRPLALALLFLFVGTGVRNMIVAGSPVSLRRRKTVGNTAAPPAPPSAEAPRKTSRSKKGPPPKNKRRGGRRKR